MSEQKLTVYQKLQKVLATGSVQSLSTSSNSYNIQQQHQPNDIVDIARSPQEKDFKILQAKQQKLMARQWYRAQQDINNQSLAGLNNVRLMYRDVDLMDTMPEIATAMDIVSEEACLSFDTEIKLLDGTIKTIEDIYKDELKNFWVYSVDENGKPKPSLVQSAIYKGKKEVYEIVLDDLTTIKCTPNHKWLLSSNEWVETSDLKVGDSLMSIYNKLDYKGYEKIKSTIEDKFTHTHIIVAENIHYDTKLSLINNNINKQKIVVHHSSFNKLNNDPNYLVYMYWNEHQKLHCDLNKKRWENEDFSNKMRAIFSETVQRTWKNKGDVIKSKLKEVWVKRKENLSKEEIKKIYGRCKENNGMFGVHRYGKTNPHFDKSKNQLTDVSENEIIETIINNRERNVSKVIQEKFNLSPHSVRTLKTKLCKKYNITEIQQLKYIFLFPKLKKYCQNNPNVKNVDVYKHFNITEIQLKYFMNFFGYKTFGDFKQQLFNHKVISIKKLNRKIKVYDLKNSSCNKAFGVKCNNGLIISHNCYIGESGSLINISSGSERVKGILQDLFVNRLSVNTTLPMLTRSMIKYGNAFWLLHTDAQLGVLGWKELPVYEIERYENGMDYPYKSGYAINNRNIDDHKDETRFVWLGQQQSTEYRNWQIAHFRLLYDSSMLPYGVSFLHKARRHYRMLSMMEDMMFIYRLDRSVERRVFKINVGAIDEADVPAYVQEIANNFKRTPIIDPMTGQIDMRKNIMPVWKKTPIPLLDGRTITIEDLAREYENGKTNYVYSIQDDTLKVVPGKVVWCGKNYTANNMIKITLDDDSFMVMAPEHEVVMRDGSKKRADKLNVGESVMPFYVNVDKTSPKRMERYEKIYNPNSGKYEYTHRLIADEVIKGDNSYNTVHHKDYNKYNNEPTNLLWCDFYEHHKMHSEVAKMNWSNAEKRLRTSKKISESKKKFYQEHPMSKEEKNKRSETMKKLHQSGKMPKSNPKGVIKWAKSAEGRKMSSMTSKKNKIYERFFLPYNNSPLHTEHNAIRSLAMTEFWKDNERSKVAKDKMTIKFDNFIWDELRNAILKGIIYNRKTMLEYINVILIEHLLDINTNERLHKKQKISRNVLQTRLSEKGFNTITSYISSIKKNHKIKKIEIIGGDDVYCMTVVGLNGEEDRHNFALRTFNQDESWNENGCFVSNCQTNDYFIPVREDGAASPIENLAAGQNLTAMDDIKYVQNKIVTALRVPKSFLNFEEAAGDGKNLSLLDVRFMRTVNRIQQALLLELNKIATIHLLMLGFTDDLTNFTLEMANPSSQAEMLELENLAKKVTTAKDAVSDPGGGMPLASMTWAWRHIFKWSDKEIQQNLEEIRLETALAAELQKTMQIIKKTHLFDPVDNIYGEPGADYSDNGNQMDDEDGGMGGGSGMGGGMPMGGDMDFGDDMDGVEMGAEGDMDMDAAVGEDAAINGQEPPMGDAEGGGAPNLGEMVTNSLKKKTLNEIIKRKEHLQSQRKKNQESVFERYMRTITKGSKDKKPQPRQIYDKAFFMNEELNDMVSKLIKIKPTSLND